MTTWSNAIIVILVAIAAVFVNGVTWYSTFPQIANAVADCRNEVLYPSSVASSAPSKGRTTTTRPTTVLHGGGIGSHTVDAPPAPAAQLGGSRRHLNDSTKPSTLSTSTTVAVTTTTTTTPPPTTTTKVPLRTTTTESPITTRAVGPLVQNNNDTTTTEQPILDSETTAVPFTETVVPLKNNQTTSNTTDEEPSQLATTQEPNHSNHSNRNSNNKTLEESVLVGGGLTEEANGSAGSNSIESDKSNRTDNKTIATDAPSQTERAASNDTMTTAPIVPSACQLSTFFGNIRVPPNLPYGFGGRDLVWLLWLSLVSFLAGWAFVMVVSVDPGTVPHAFLQSSPKSSTLAIKLTGGLSLCPPCAAFKPLRTHHCSRCERCVLKYDHHCPWIGQCVGFFNYKLYLLMIGYIHILSWTYLILLGRAVWIDFAGDSPCATITSALLPTAVCHTTNGANWTVIVSFLLCLVAMCLTLYLICVHVPLALHNVTTVEAVIARWQAKEAPEQIQENMYDLGAAKNLEQIFGDADWDDREKKGILPRWLCRVLPFAPYPAQSVEVLYSLQTYRSVLQPTPNPSAISGVSGAATAVTSLQSRLSTNYGTVDSQRDETGEGRPSATATMDAAEAIENMISHDSKFLGILFPTTIGRTMQV